MNQRTHPDRPRYEVVVVGGGAAGLSGAVTLARARRSVLVIDAGSPRNAPAAHAHNYLTRDGIPPLELLALGREEATAYGAEIVEGEVVAAERLDDDGFLLSLDGGASVVADRLLVTTGLVDELPEIPGVAQRWGRDVVHCPYCHGWEVADQAIAVLGIGPLSVHQALMWRQWSKDVTLLVHTAPSLTDQDREQLAARDIRVVHDQVERLEVTADRLTGVRLETGEVIACQALVVAPRVAARAGFLADLDLKPADLAMNGHVIGTRIPVEATGATQVPGIWAAGNVTDPFDQVIGAAAAGVRAAAHLNADLIARDTRRAVEARRR